MEENTLAENIMKQVGTCLLVEGMGFEITDDGKQPDGKEAGR